MAMHTITIHRYFGRQKVQGASAPLATETTPHHNTSGVLHIPDGVALIVSIGHAQPPDLLGPGTDEAECAFVAKHNGFLVPFIPEAVLLAKVEPLFDHLGHHQRLFATPDCANFLDHLQQNVLPTIDLGLQLFRRFEWAQPLVQLAVCQPWSSRMWLGQLRIGRHWQILDRTDNLPPQFQSLYAVCFLFAISVAVTPSAN